MQYVEMTIEEALKYSKGKTVLVAVSDLENNDEVNSFVKRNAADCENIFNEAETIVRVYDDLINQLRAFTEKQNDFINYKPRGKLSIIILKE